jgi:hypothetical protein
VATSNANPAAKSKLIAPAIIHMRVRVIDERPASAISTLGYLAVRLHSRFQSFLEIVA